MTGPNAESVEMLLRDELAHGDATLSTATPILRYLLRNEDQALFSDQIVAGVRGMLTDVARQMLHAQAEAAQVTDPAGFVAEREDVLAQGLFSEAALLRQAQALAFEAQLTLRLQAQAGIDPVLSPLLQDLMALQDDLVASVAMAALAAQARFIQHWRRMELPVGELPAEVFHQALLVFRYHAGGDDAAAAERVLRRGYDESKSRLGLLSRLVMRLGEHAPRALGVHQAGLPIFATALAMASWQDRVLVVQSLSDRQYARLALTLCVAGLDQAAVEEQFLYFHPEVTLPEGFETLSGDRAALLLAASGLGLSD